MKKRLVLAFITATCATLMTVTSVAADPTWPPRTVRCPKQHVCVEWKYRQTQGTACFMTPFNAPNRTGRPCK